MKLVLILSFALLFACQGSDDGGNTESDNNDTTAPDKLTLQSRYESTQLPIPFTYELIENGPVN